MSQLAEGRVYMHTVTPTRTAAPPACPQCGAETVRLETRAVRDKPLIITCWCRHGHKWQPPEAHLLRPV